MKAKNKKILIICIIVVALIGIGIGLLFYFNDGYTYTPDGQVSNPNYYSDEIPFLEGVKMGMSYDQVRSAVRNIESNSIWKKDESEYDDDFSNIFYYIDTGEYAYTINSSYSVHLKNKYDEYGDRVYLYFLFSDDKLINVKFYNALSDEDKRYKTTDIMDLYGNPNYIENKIFGDKLYYWYTDKFIITCNDSNVESLELWVRDISYDPDKVTMK